MREGVFTSQQNKKTTTSRSDPYLTRSFLSFTSGDMSKQRRFNGKRNARRKKKNNGESPKDLSDDQISTTRCHRTEHPFPPNPENGVHTSADVTVSWCPPLSLLTIKGLSHYRDLICHYVRLPCRSIKNENKKETSIVILDSTGSVDNKQTTIGVHGIR
ncbi:hypothetical protein GWI33_017597 [Rhynchophorus ferrugineus]|uniref:Uncharacterized protein n=1 Tax=Rhynchophorus ferrugineus TaxID=354439 RepID=A0A834HV42_RHYFE|nr:hypothetical protein GWI33_017597 [Rhynchophorus ferrugineus]